MTPGKDAQGRDSRGHFIKGHVPHNKQVDNDPPAIARNHLIGGGEVRVEHVHVTCPACRQQVDAIAMNGRVKGYCAVAMQYVDFPVQR